MALPCRLLPLALACVLLGALCAAGQRPTSLGSGGSAPTTSPAPSATSPAPPSPTSPAPSSGSKQCVIVPNANAEGDTIDQMDGVASIADCCTACQQASSCNVFVYCPASGGCDNGSGTVYASQLCTLKSYPLQPGKEPSYFARGSIVPWTSGYLI
ncbi:hypothetical protein ABPG75_005437 [Micractinium tetrahymenae]